MDNNNRTAARRSLLRLFIGVDTPPEVRTWLGELQKSLRGQLANSVFRWIGEKNFHITLHFLGDVPQDAIPQISEVMTKTCAAIRPFPLYLAAVGVFPTLRRPRVVWTGVTDPTKQLQAIQEGLSRELARLREELAVSYHVDDRSFSPHITLAYVRNNAPRDSIRQSVEKLAHIETGNSPEFTVNEIALVHSTLTPTGSIYRKVARADL